jgi:hypothetical protein
MSGNRVLIVEDEADIRQAVGQDTFAAGIRALAKRVT